MLNLNEIILSIETFNSNINPTIIYNEGWMIRLLIHYSIRENLKLESIDFSCIFNWTSEALISSPFVKVKKHKENYTHADIAIGDFDVEYKNCGKINVKPDANLFGIIEAKMGSNLSKGTKNVKDYNQASRNLVCIAYNTLLIENCKTFFYVVVPESKIKPFKIKQQIDKNNLKNEIQNRFSFHSSDQSIYSLQSKVISIIDNSDIKAISYENWISKFSNSTIKKELEDFDKEVKKWNRIK